MAHDALRFTDVGVRYPKASRAALQNVSLNITPGEFVLLTGLSGCGKSTLLRAGCGLVPHFYGGEFIGSVDVGGMNTRTYRPRELAATVGTVLQDPESQLVMGTVRCELAFPLENRGWAGDDIACAVEETALALGIESLLDRPTDQLSGGESQRVVLAAAMVCRPEVLLLDEPTSQLDPVAGDELIWLLARLNQEWGMAVVLAEHRLENCLRLADRVIVLEKGRVVCDRTPQTFLAWARGVNPALLTPTAQLFAGAGIEPLPLSVKQARHALHEISASTKTFDRHTANGVTEADLTQNTNPVVQVKHLWHEVRQGPVILRDIQLSLAAGELVALVGANGSGKSTLLRHLGGLMQPTRGEVQTQGRVAVLLQNPGDYLLHDRVCDEADDEMLAQVGLSELADRHPNDLSGGERQRLALAAVLSGGQPAPCLCLDEPTRGMDHQHRDRLVAILG
jgi:energy-coupling factor transport system ATP-binding protein